MPTPNGHIALILLICIMKDHSMAYRNVLNQSTSVCRDRLGYFYPEDFKISACSLCYFYLVVQDPVFVLDHVVTVKQLHTEPFLLLRNNQVNQTSRNISPAFDNQASIDLVCDTMDDATCSSWVTCCKGAWDCCKKQIERKPPEDESLYCPQTFDGWDCWDFTPLNQSVSQLCPSFLSSAEGAKSSKVCGMDGTWKNDTDTGLEYTVYDDCSISDKKQMFKTPIIIGLVLNITGIILMFPAITIYIIYRSLRKQHRIKIHVNFFLSIMVTSILCTVWDVTVRLDRLATDQEHSFLHTQQVMCKCLHVLHRFARASMFFWMSCEGFFLHRLLVNAFTPPKRFYGYVLYGWGMPVLLCCTYASLRKYFADDRLCWILPLEGDTIALDWILIYSPAIICILVNVIFLFSILRLLLRKTTTHPNEPSNFRKIIKATFILVPLFGIHQFCLVYRPSADTDPGYEIYEISSAIILNSQGIISSLLFCYFNTEVQSHVKLSFKKLGRRYSHRRTKDGRKLSLSVSTTSRRTSVSSLQNGGVATLCGGETANSKPLNDTEVKIYGNGQVKGTGFDLSGSTPCYGGNENHCYLGESNIELYTPSHANDAACSKDNDDIQDSVKL